MRPVIRLASLGVVFVAAVAWSYSPPARGEAVSDGELDALWLSPGQAYPVPRVDLQVTAPAEVSCGTPLNLDCVIRTHAAYPATVVYARVVKGTDEIASLGETTLDLVPGANACTIQWDASMLPTGKYRIIIEVDYASGTARARYEIPLVRVTGKDLAQRLAKAADHQAALAQRFAAAKDEAAVTPYARLRIRIAEEVLERARADQAASRWHAFYHKLQYIETTLPSLDAWLAFGALSPELQAPAPPRLVPGALARENGGLAAHGRPVFLFGKALKGTDVAEVARLEGYGLNLATVELPPRVTLASPTATAPFESEYNVLFTALREAGIAVVATLAPRDVPAWLLERSPDVADKGFVDLAHARMKELVRRHLRAAMPYLAGKESVLGVAVAEAPRFRFDSEATRQAFIARVRALYPDRQVLNRTWDAHLGNYGEIGIWGNYPGYAHLAMGETGEDWRYQSNSAYQFDWQSFHQGRARAYLAGLLDKARTLADGLPTGIMVSGHVFEEGRTRQDVNREDVFSLTNMGFCSAAARPSDPFFAMRYPRPFAFYDLLRSYEPGVPVLNIKAGFFGEKPDTAPLHGRYVHSAVWESVMAGLTGMTLPADSPVFDLPEALEGYATAALDINRLAPLVRAFQEAPARVGVLFSRSSAIYRDGDPHVRSALDAFEGASFSGYAVRFVSEEQCNAETLKSLDVMVIPETPALSDAAFDALSAYIDGGGVAVRLGTPIPYTERGASRTDVLPTTARTILVRGLNLPTEYLHAMDAAIALGSLPAVTRVVNAEGYPLEGVRTRCIEFRGETYLYLLNLRKDPVICHLTGNAKEGRDLIRGRTVRFPLPVLPLDVMLIRLEKPTSAWRWPRRGPAPGRLPPSAICEKAYFHEATTCPVPRHDGYRRVDPGPPWLNSVMLKEDFRPKQATAAPKSGRSYLGCRKPGQPAALSSMVAPVPSSCSLSLLASSSARPSLTGAGALSTSALASLSPRPAISFTSLMTWILLEPTSFRMTS